MSIPNNIIRTILQKDNLSVMCIKWEAEKVGVRLIEQVRKYCQSR